MLRTLFPARSDNEAARQRWLSETLAALPAGLRLLDAGAGELRNRVHCRHLDYVSQDFGQYDGLPGGCAEGLQDASWDTSRVDLVCDITAIPCEAASFDVILCSEVLEHIPDPCAALDEFTRLLRPGGVLIITAPFASNVHMAPYHFCTGFSRYWYEHHLPRRGFTIRKLSPNGDWYALLRQELRRLGPLERQRGNSVWPLAYAYGLLGRLYFRLRRPLLAADVACFGWHCLAVKQA